MSRPWQKPSNGKPFSLSLSMERAKRCPLNSQKTLTPCLRCAVLIRISNVVPIRVQHLRCHAFKDASALTRGWLFSMSELSVA